MNICLKTYAKQMQPTHLKITLHDRLPTWIESDCEIECTFQIKPLTDYYLLNLSLQATLPITCQRCLTIVPYHYHNTIELALCATEEKADQLMSTMDCIVVSHEHINLEDILTDELHLTAPEIPHEIEQCHLLVD